MAEKQWKTKCPCDTVADYTHRVDDVALYV
jgi:hypothetical protein